MKAKELMIGDWVLYTGDGEPVVKYVAELTSLNQVYLYNHKLDPGSWILVGAKYVSPIPLSPEILEKHGFERTSDGWECNESDVLTIAIHDGDSCDIWIAEAPFDRKHLTYILPFTRSVHELQHALRLCGIDKEIEL